MDLKVDGEHPEGCFFIAKIIEIFQRYFTRKKLYFYYKINDEEDSDYEIFSRRINCTGSNFMLVPVPSKANNNHYYYAGKYKKVNLV